MPKKLYFSIRVVRADSKQDAIDCVEDGLFIVDHEYSDVVLSEKEIEFVRSEKLQPMYEQRPTHIYHKGKKLHCDLSGLPLNKGIELCERHNLPYVVIKVEAHPPSIKKFTKYLYF